MSSSGPMRAFLFDFGNVIAFFDHLRACQRVAEMSGSRLTAEKIYETIFVSGLEEKICTGAMTGDEFLQILAKEFALDSDPAEIEHALCDIFWPNPAVIELIPRLKELGHRIVLASNTNELHWRWMQREFDDPLRHFDALIVSHEVRCWKPDPKFYDACLKAAGLHRERCLYIDDRPDLTAAAEQLGIPSITYLPETDLTAAFRERGIRL